MTSRKTDGQRLARLAIDNWPDEIWIAERIDRIIRRRMAEAWTEGHEYGVIYEDLEANPYQGRKRK
jgi:hypothetical protein